MRKVFCAAITAICVVGLTVPATHAVDDKNSKVVVHGQNLDKSGLRYSSRVCGLWKANPFSQDAASTTVYALYKKPGLIGQRAIGWEFGASGGVTGSEAGPLAYVRNAGALSSLRFSGYVRNAGGSPEGHLIVYLFPDGAASDDYYVGDERLNTTHARQWSTWTGFTKDTLQWFHWEGTGFQDSDGNGADTFSYTIKGLANAVGGASAYVGPELGCTGQSWYVDDLRVGTGGSTRTYDFEGVRTDSVLGSWRKVDDPVNKVVWGLRHVVRNYGEAAWVDGYGAYYNDLRGGGHDVGDYVFFGAKGTLFVRHYGSKKWHRYGTKHFTVKGSAAFKLKKLSRHAEYYFAYAGNSQRAPSRTQVMSIDVRAELKGHLTNKTVFRGAHLTVAGQRLPGVAGAKVQLQRRVGGHWRTIGTGRTRAHGTFGVSALAGSLGTWTLRLVSPKGKGNLGNQTKTFVVHIKKRPAKPTRPVVTTPPPCTTCAGGSPDVPIGGKAKPQQGVGAHGHGRASAPGRLPPGGVQAPRRQPGW